MLISQQNVVARLPRGIIAGCRDCLDILGAETGSENGRNAIASTLDLNYGINTNFVGAAGAKQVGSRRKGDKQISVDHSIGTQAAPLKCSSINEALDLHIDLKLPPHRTSRACTPAPSSWLTPKPAWGSGSGLAGAAQTPCCEAIDHLQHTRLWVDAMLGSPVLRDRHP